MLQSKETQSLYSYLLEDCYDSRCMAFFGGKVWRAMYKTVTAKPSLSLPVAIAR